MNEHEASFKITRVIVVGILLLLTSFVTTCTYDNELARSQRTERLEILADSGVSARGIDCIMNSYSSSTNRHNACASWIREGRGQFE